MSMQAATIVDSADVKRIAEMLPAKPLGVGAPVTDRAAWERVAATGNFKGIVGEAESLARTQPPEVTDDLYLDYSRTGNRDHGQQAQNAWTRRVTSFALAECLENKGRFIVPLQETVAGICREKSWTMPAHDGSLAVFNGKTMDMDLRATAVAWQLATADWLLGSKLDAATRKLIHDEVERRVLRPYRDAVEGKRKEIHWTKADHNWNAVCHAGVVGAALALEESREDRALYIAAAQHYLRTFLKGFTPDGYCSEGLGYWNYGFGNFLQLGETIRQSTGGKIDMLADPLALEPALFPERDQIINGLCPSIADCHPGTRPATEYVRFIGERLGMDLAAGHGAEFVRPMGELPSTVLFSFLPSPLPVISHEKVPTPSPLRTWFKDGGVLICRPAVGSTNAFAAVLKGGNNAEHHNHNDVGSFSVVLGREMVICDPGGEVYTKRTFSPQRYDSKVLNSFGHAVPVVAGKLQRTGAAAHAVVLKTDFTEPADTLSLDIKSAYEVPQLQKLNRTFVFRRDGAGELVIRDEVAFSEAQTFESALITWGDWEQIGADELRITDHGSSARVKIDAGGKAFKINAERIQENVPMPTKPLRLGIALEAPVREAKVTLTVTPEAEGKASAAKKRSARK